jgi:hypothetical protein
MSQFRTASQPRKSSAACATIPEESGKQNLLNREEREDTRISNTFAPLRALRG